MKSLKRSLCLVLALVMVLGMFGAASAASFKDDNTIQYKEAVDVMTGIGAISGYTDGTFNPKGTVTRAEAAKMVAYAVLGANVAKNLSGVASSFTDVNANFAWAIPSIEYLVSVGAINGYPDGTFAPNGNVTGYEIAKMLLVCLGIDGEYTGAGWTLDVAINANKIGLFDGRVTSANPFNDAASREECALYCFNAILYSPSGSTEKIWSVIRNDVKQINVGTEAEPEWVTVLEPVYGWVEVPIVAKGSIAAAVYPTLTPDYEDEDDLGRPATTWKYGKPAKTISSVALAPIATFNKGFTQGDLYKLVGVAGNVATVINSKNAQTTGNLVSTKNATTLPANAAFATNSGCGIITEIYQVGSTGTIADYVAVMIQPSFAELTNIVPTRASSTKGAYNTYYFDGVAAGVVFTSIVDAETDITTASFNGTVAKGDMVLYYKGAAGHYYSSVNTISGIVSSITSAGVVTVGSVKTARAAAAGALSISVNATKEQSFYVDEFGYILGAKTGAAVLPVVFVLGMDSYNVIEGGKIVTTYSAIVANLDGTVTSVPVDSTEYAARAASTGFACSYTVDDDGYYEFAALATADSTTTLKVNSDVTKITNKTNALTTTETSVTLASNSTLFVVANFDSKGNPTGTVTVYTGVNNVPTLGAVTALAKTTALSYGTAADGVAEIVFVYDNVSGSAATPYVYVIGTYEQTSAGYVLDVIINGQYDTITVNAAGLTELLVTKGPGLYSAITLSGTTVVAAQTAKATTTTDSILNNGNLLFLNGSYANMTIANDVPVFTIYAADASVVTGTAADLTSTLTVTDGIYVVPNPSAPTTVAAVYIVVPAA